MLNSAQKDRAYMPCLQLLPSMVNSFAPTPRFPLERQTWQSGSRRYFTKKSVETLESVLQ